MVKEIAPDRQERLEKFLKAVEEARKLQDDFLKYGLDCVDLYVEDVGGDWLEKWGEDEEELDTIASPLVGDSVVESLTAFLKSDDLVAVKVRERLGGRSVSEIVAELEKCWNLPEEDRSDAVMDIFVGSGVTTGGTNRDSSDDNDGIELVELVDDLLEKLAELLGNHN